MSVAASSAGAAVPGLTRSDPHAPGIIREKGAQSVHYRDATGRRVTDIATLERIAALSIPPAWKDVWISPDPLGHIQATGVDSRGRTQYRYHPVWREQREVQKFTHMLRFAVRYLTCGRPPRGTWLVRISIVTGWRPPRCG